MKSSILFKLFAILAIIFSALAAPLTLEDGQTINYKKA